MTKTVSHSNDAVGGEMKIRKIFLASVTAAVLAGSAITTSGASEVTGEFSINKSQAFNYINSNPNIHVADPAFFESESFVIVDSNAVPQALPGNPAGILKQESVEATTPYSGCGYRRAAFTSAYNWTESTNGCGIIGASWNANYLYTWTKDRYFLNVASDSCVQGRGYYYSLGISEPRWQNAGCGANGRVVATIGNRATVAKVRGKTMTTTPSSVYWR